MLKRYWRLIFAIAGLGAVGAGSYAGYDLLYDIEKSNTAQQSYQPARDARFPALAENSKIAPSGYQPNCEAPQNKDDADLCAQWAMVGATDRSNNLAASQIWLTFFEIVALVVTISFTAWAAVAAANAAKVARQSLDLFQKVESGLLVPSLVVNSRDTVTVSLRNKGRTSVVVLLADLCCQDSPMQEPIPLALSGTEFGSDALIGESANYVFGGGPMTIQHSGQCAYIYGAAIYRTIFGKVHLARIAIKMDRTTGTRSVIPKADFSVWENQMRKTFGPSAELD